MYLLWQKPVPCFGKPQIFPNAVVLIVACCCVQAGKLRAVVAQRGGTHGGPGSLPGVPQTAAASPHDPPAAQSSTERLHSTTKNLVALLHLG